ncbi:cell wall-binding repeat-containing protein [Plantactinospora soyae]|uniref:Dipeptidyl aminopeptidase/acylaminoacyl peptidase n=1 Tax=Plantactinospora soyae TaxID=1544732 RepID=A0A927M3Y3_9ACTN|nr:cell wall-binding repeat-containing protein [Plantactinospora soyae]MBE1486356.1 dipeptidyl aminopeptidase/acylaminoacyl peptidase [Plantactinospora soyae]
MPPRFIHRPLALASVVALGATAAIAGTTAVQASPAGTGNVLTSSNGSTSITFSSGAKLTLDSPEDPTITTMHGAAWAPDGSRAIFATENGRIATVRHNEGWDYWWMSAPDNVQRRDPSYRGDGIGVLWAAKQAGQPWRLEVQVSSGGFTANPISPQDGRHYLAPDSGPGSLFVYQTQADSGGVPSGTPDVGVFDPNTDDGFQTILSNASNPAMAPNGKKVAFIRSDGTRNQVWVANIDGSNVVQVTSNAANHDNPVWSPDGNTVAFSQNTGVATAPANGSGAATPTTVANLSGVPSYQPRRSDKVVRVFGQNRYTTAAAVSQSHWATASNASDPRQSAEGVVLSRSDLFADALGGAALAAAKQGPLLMTHPNGLDVTTRTEIQRILAPGKTVYLLGSPGAISTTVENQVTALGYQVKRLAGQNRYTTSLAIADEINPEPTWVFAATGANFPDALAAGAAAGSFNTPGSDEAAVVILTRDYVLDPATETYLNELNERSVVVGVGLQGKTATAQYNPIEIYGTNRYETALMTAWGFFGGTAYAGIATGADWPDALAGGALMATINGPMLLTRGGASTLSLEPELFLDEHSGSLHSGLIFGSAGVVATGQQAGVGTWISGPGGYTQVQNPTNIGINGAVGVNSAAKSKRAKTATEPTGRRTPEQIRASLAELQERLER